MVFICVEGGEYEATVDVAVLVAAAWTKSRALPGCTIQIPPALDSITTTSIIDMIGNGYSTSRGRVQVAKVPTSRLIWKSVLAFRLGVTINYLLLLFKILPLVVVVVVLVLVMFD